MAFVATALIERKPSVDDPTSSIEFLQLLSASLVRLVTAQTAAPAAAEGDLPAGLDMLVPTLACMVSYLESDVKVCHQSFFECILILLHR